MLTKKQHRALTHLAHDSEQCLLTDTAHAPEADVTYQHLARKRLARCLGDGLYRITLAGLAYLREGHPPAAPDGTMSDRLIRAIREHPGSSARDLTRIAGVQRTSAQNLLKQLARKGMVDRHQRPDGRTYAYHPARRRTEAP